MLQIGVTELSVGTPVGRDDRRRGGIIGRRCSGVCSSKERGRAPRGGRENRAKEEGVGKRAREREREGPCPTLTTSTWPLLKTLSSCSVPRNPPNHVVDTFDASEERTRVAHASRRAVRTPSRSSKVARLHDLVATMVPT